MNLLSHPNDVCSMEIFDIMYTGTVPSKKMFDDFIENADEYDSSISRCCWRLLSCSHIDFGKSPDIINYIKVIMKKFVPFDKLFEIDYFIGFKIDDKIPTIEKEHTCYFILDTYHNDFETHKDKIFYFSGLNEIQHEETIFIMMYFYYKGNNNYFLKNVFSYDKFISFIREKEYDLGFAEKYYIYSCAYNDGYISADNNIKRFFEIMSRFPPEIGMKICCQLSGKKSEFISSQKMYEAITGKK